jgi:dicarboxylate transporter 10
MSKEQKVSRWYFGGIASAMACCCTHPLDLLKVQLQTQQEGKISVVKLTVNIVKKQGEISCFRQGHRRRCRML